MVNQNNRMFMIVKKGSTSFRHARIFYGRGGLINHLKAWSHFKTYLDDYDILEITSINVKIPSEDFKNMDFKVQEEDTGPKIVRNFSESKHDHTYNDHIYNKNRYFAIDPYK